VSADNGPVDGAHALVVLPIHVRALRGDQRTILNFPQG
jgi:hypothetical protein